MGSVGGGETYCRVVVAAVKRVEFVVEYKEVVIEGVVVVIEGIKVAEVVNVVEDVETAMAVV